MPVNLNEPTAQSVLAVKGVELGVAYAGIRSSEANDVMLMRFAPGATAAAVFTRNRFCAAPVHVCRDNLTTSSQQIRAIVINAGNANAGTGATGLADAQATTQCVAQEIACAANEVLPMSTGVILEPLPMDKLLAAIPKAAAHLSADHWLDAAKAIMTTDTVPKVVSASGKVGDQSFVVTGLAKGAGMIRPNMGTMLAVITTDAAIEPGLLQQWTQDAADQSFNRITVDGDTSTNDTLAIIATGAGECQVDNTHQHDAQPLRDALNSVSQQLAQAIIRDGEGASKFITIHVDQADTEEHACAVAYAIAHSPLVKTAFFASDANLGRLLCAIGYADVPNFDTDVIELYLGDVLVAANGGRHPDYKEQDGERIMSQDEIEITVRLNRGAMRTTVWTCDLSHDYVTINAEYRT